MAQGVPLFGVCLGLQGIVEYFGGRLGVLGVPAHGIDTAIQPMSSPLFEGISRTFRAGRYHSLHAEIATMPDVLRIVAMSDDDVVMGIEHVSEPVWAVQFHPESIMTKNEEVGLRLIKNVLTMATASRRERQPQILESIS
jgi:anthranilate synthase